MEQEKEDRTEVLKKIEKIREIKDVDKELFKVNDILELYKINEKLLEIANRELDKNIVPSKEVLDTIQLSLIISAVLS